MANSTRKSEVMRELPYDLARLMFVVPYILLGLAVEWKILYFGLPALIIIFFLIFPLFPGAVAALANEPNAHRPEPSVPPHASKLEAAKARGSVSEGYDPHTFAFFTFISPGVVKIIVRGDRFRRAIMRYDGRSFYGDTVTTHDDGTKLLFRDREYWDVDQTPKRSEDSHPIPTKLRKGYTDPIWWWSRYVYEITGAVFTGIPPFQTVYVYWLERLKHIKGEQSEVEFYLKQDWSDQFRVAEFQFFILVAGAETRDRLPIDIKLSVTLKVNNPYKAAYDIEDSDWATQVNTQVNTEIINVVNRLYFQEIAAHDPDSEAEVQGVEAIARAVHMLSRDDEDAAHARISKAGLSRIGVRIEEVEVLSIEGPPALREALAAAAVAKAQADAVRQEAAGQHDAVKKIREALTDEQSAVIYQMEAGIKRAKEAQNIQIVEHSTDPFRSGLAQLQAILGQQQGGGEQ